MKQQAREDTTTLPVKSANQFNENPIIMFKNRRRKPTATTTRKITSQHHQKLKHCPPLATKTLLLTILISATATSLMVNANNGSQDGADKLAGRPKAEPLTQQQPTSSNVIIIKYANVSSQTDSADQSAPTDSGAQLDDDANLSLFKLYDQPLSVSVIESKFSDSIVKFDISYNQLATLPKDLFCPLSNKVKLLNISHNLLDNFDFLGMVSQAGQLCSIELKILDMSFNSIKHLPPTGIATLQNLEILNLSHNLLETLDELSISSLFKLTKLDLSHNRIQHLPASLFQKSFRMTHLSLQFNQLQTNINQLLLSNLHSIEEINLSFNNISHVGDSAFADKINLTRVDLSHNQLTSLRQEAVRVTSLKQAQAFKHRLHHNGQYAGPTPNRLVHSQAASAIIYLAANPFICDCQLEWLRRYQPAIKPKSVLSGQHQRSFQQHEPDPYGSQLMQLTSSSNGGYQSDQPVIGAAVEVANSNNVSEIPSQSSPSTTTIDHASSSQLARPLNGLASQHLAHHSARIGDLDLIKCTPLFRRNTQKHHHRRPLAPPDGSHGHPAGGHHHHQLQESKMMTTMKQDAMIDLVGADASNFLCRYKSHCFALCHCCEFDACDCEMICPSGCNCYYDLTWQTNIIDCSSNNHTVVPDRIPMDVSGLYLDGNQIESLKPSNLIARKSLKTLFLNATNLQFIANRTFNGLIELQTLYLNDNQLRQLQGYEFEPLAQLRALYLQSNRLEFINNHTFIYLRSLEILDLSNNRLTHNNLDLFWSIGHHNIRLRQLSIAHNWWSCQCSSISRFRQILKQKFLLNGSVNIADKSQLRCYHNHTTVGPLILAEQSALGQQQQPLYASFQDQFNRQQTVLSEFNSCSEIVEPPQMRQDFNPPLIRANDVLVESPTPSPQPEENNSPFQNDPFYHGAQQQQPPAGYSNPTLEAGMYPPMMDYPPPPVPPMRPVPSASTGMPLTSFILLSILFAGIMIVAVSVFVFVRQQQRFNQNHHKKSSAASTASNSSSASSTAISSLNATKSSSRANQQQQHSLLNAHHHHHHLIMSNGGTSVNHQLLQQQQHLHHHQHSASSQSNIYAALVSPTTGNSTTVTNTAAGSGNNLYSNSSTTASHHSSSSNYPHQQQHHQPHWQQANSQLYNNQPYGATNVAGFAENHYALNASQASYKGATSLYGNAHDLVGGPVMNAAGPQNQPDWIRLPKVKQFMSKLVNKSLALGGLSKPNSRDELNNISSDKIYDAFISYDKRDEAFVMKHLSAELEYGQPQYR